jgi:hypothetical protein
LSLAVEEEIRFNAATFDENESNEISGDSTTDDAPDFSFACNN